jgi:hypothetical protein
MSFVVEKTTVSAVYFCVYMYACIYMHIYWSTCIRSYEYVINIHTKQYIHTYIHTYIHASMTFSQTRPSSRILHLQRGSMWQATVSSMYACSCIQAYTHIHLDVCMYVCIYTRTRVSMGQATVSSMYACSGTYIHTCLLRLTSFPMYICI